MLKIIKQLMDIWKGLIIFWLEHLHLLRLLVWRRGFQKWLPSRHIHNRIIYVLKLDRKMMQCYILVWAVDHGLYIRSF